MRLSSFEWDDANVAHIVRHNVTPEEVEEAFQGRHQIRRSIASRYTLLARSAAGRYLMIAFILRAGTVRTITARDMTSAERRRYS
ncbi:MAG: BrnT family toxin [Elusimicrobiota bacterium]